MMNLPSYERLTEAERSRVPAIRETLYADAIAFFAPELAHIPDKTFHMLAEIIAVSAAWEEAARLSPCMRFCVWMYLLDYFVDEMPGVTAAHLDDLQARMARALSKGGPGADAPFLDCSLASIRDDLARTPTAPALLGVIEAQIGRELGASAALFAFKDGQGIEDYLALATQCVNHISCSLSLALAIGEPLTAAQGNALLETLQPAARAIRLANDLRTHSKDSAEGRPHALAFAWDRAQVMKEIQASLARFEAGLSGIHGAGRTVEGLRRITRVGVEVYGITDIKLDL